MKQLTLSVLLILTLELLLSECANPKAPTGGPRDSIPPTLVESFPPSESINTNEKEITLVFDEWINADKLKPSLIITPNIESKYKSITKKNELVLKFEDPFPDSTTVTFNFLDGVTDATERTPAVNLTYVFSTGHYIDSLIVSGEVKNLMTDTPMERAVVGLYTFSDTLDIFISKPTYFTTSDENGEFEIRNIKSGTYKLVAFADQNRNLVFDASQESHGFLSELIQLDTNVLDLIIPMVKQDASELKLITSRTLGNKFDVQYSKALGNVIISPDIPNGLSEDFKTVRIYQRENFDIADSLESFIRVVDSLGNEMVDTVFVKFNNNIRNPDQFVVAITPSGKKILPLQDYKLTFTKPIKFFDQTGIKHAKDSTLFYPIDSLTDFKWNRSRHQLQFTLPFDTTRYFKDQNLLIAEADSFTRDTTNVLVKSDSIIAKKELGKRKTDLTGKPSSQPKRPALPKMTNSIDLTFPEGTFISIENDTLDVHTKKGSFLKQLEVAVIFLTVITEEPSYMVQLISPSYKVLKEFPGASEITIGNLLPGEYGIRVLIDENQDGKWSTGNILENKEPESVYILDGFTTLRANWDNPITITF